jgi:hypothetical protein
MGEYAVNTDAAGNSLIAGMGHSVPSFASAGDETGALTVQHTEYIKDIYGQNGTTMDSTIVVINPGLAESFPWLSQIAANYEEYQILQCMFCYKSKVSDNLTSNDGQIGSILMFTEYNANDPMKKTKQQLIQAYGTTNALISTADILHGVECDTSKLKGDGHKYIRTESLSANVDKSDYDHAKMQLAVVDAPSQLQNQVVGELYVSYTVVLRKPRLFSTLGLAIQEDQFYITYSGANSVAAAGEFNSIGALLSNTTVNLTTTGISVKITLPASFSGDLEVLATIDATQANPTIYPYFDQKTGNVTTVSNIAVTDRNNDPNPVLQSGITSNDSACAIGHLRVSQASSGVDNSWRLFFGNVGQDGNGQIWISLRRYNGHESDSAPTFKQLLTDGKIDPQDITVAISN